MNGYWISAVGGIVVGALLGTGIVHTIDSKALSTEQAAHAADKAQYAADIGATKAEAAKAASDALAKQTAMQQQADQLNDQLTKEQAQHEADNRKLRADLAAGTQRVRVAVRNCTAVSGAGGGGSADNPQPAGGRDDTAASADLDPAVAERVFGVAADDDREIDKLRKLQAWACVVKTRAPGCGNADGSADGSAVSAGSR